MATRTRTQPAGYSLPEPVDIVLKEGKITEGVVTTLMDLLKSITRKINGQIAFGNGDDGTWAGNLDAQYVTASCPTSANVEFIVPHGLGRVPRGYEVVRKDRAVDVYDSRADAWTSSTMYLKASVASALINLRIW